MKTIGMWLGFVAILAPPAFSQQKTDREHNGLQGEVYAVRESRTYPAPKGTASAIPESHTTSYYDKKGDLTLQLIYQSGRMVTRKTFRHTGPDEVVEKIENSGVDPAADVTGPNPPPPEIISHRFKFDGLGNLIEESLFSENGKLIQRSEYTRDQQGRLRETNLRVFERNGARPKTTFEYGDGNLPTASVYEPFPKQTSRETYSYELDARSNWTKKRVQQSGAVVERTITYYSTENGEAVPIPGESPADALQPIPLSDLPKMIRKSGGVLQSSATRRIEPSYPIQARAAHVTGTVQVEVRIDHTGAVVEARALSGPLELQDAAVHAAKQWRFAPTKLSGVLVDVIGTINFNFLM